MNALELAQYIISEYPDKYITPMKLQKLAYYAKVWTLVAGESWIDAEFKKWEYGPVNADIYHAYKGYGSKAIKNTQGASSQPDPVKSKLLAFILDNYINYSAFTLSAMTHNEEPWTKTASNEVISDALIKAYYCTQPFAKNFTHNNTDKTFHVVHSNTWHSFVLDMDHEEAEKYGSYPSYEEFCQHHDKAKAEFDKLLAKLGGIPQ